MPSLSLPQVASYLLTQPSILAITGPGDVWLDVPADTSTLPYIVLTVGSVTGQYQTSGTRISYMRFNVVGYAGDVATLDNLMQAVINVMPANQAVTVANWGLLVENGPTPRGLVEGAYSAVISYLCSEDLIQ